MFGGLSRTWIDEAEDILDTDTNVIYVAPLSGPPHPEGILKGQSDTSVRPYSRPRSYAFNSVSTRLFVTRPQLIESRMGYLEGVRPSFNQQLKAFLLGNPPQSREFEAVLSHAHSITHNFTMMR